MGCWNGTCALTHLAIHAGEPCKFIILSPYVYARDSALCYPHEMFAPVCLPLSGVYDDYGAIEDIEQDANAAFALDWFNLAHKHGDIVLTSRGEQMNHYDEISRPPDEPYSLQELVTFIERDYLAIKTPTMLRSVTKPNLKPNLKLTFMLVGKEAYDTAVSIYLPTQPPVTSRDTRATYAFDIDGSATLSPAVFEPLVSSGKLAEFAAFVRFMDSARMHFSPQSGAGAQHDNHRVNAAIAKVTLAISERRGKQEEEWAAEEAKLEAEIAAEIEAGNKGVKP